MILQNRSITAIKCHELIRYIGFPESKKGKDESTIILTFNDNTVYLVID